MSPQQKSLSDSELLRFLSRSGAVTYNACYFATAPLMEKSAVQKPASSPRGAMGGWLERLPYWSNQVFNGFYISNDKNLGTQNRMAQDLEKQYS